METMKKEALIPKFYAGRSIFITGASGFLGKVLVERLLETCPDIGNLYLLMRVKKNVPPEKRLQQIKQSPVFDVIRDKCPWQLDKMRVVPGDTTLPWFGMSEDALRELQEVSVVFHSAATLKFDEELRVALQQNVRSVTRLLQIADDHMPQLQVLMHVSTAYSNPERSEVGEVVYPPPATPEQLEALVETMDPGLLNSITKQYIFPKPNTYTFTKSVAEGVLAQHSYKRYPITIFRPSIVVSSLRSPFPGWIENLNGASGVLVGVGSGLLHVMQGSLPQRADYLPVDIAADSMVAAAWQVAVERPTEVKVYNCCTYDNPLTWSQTCENMTRDTRNIPFDNCMTYPLGSMCRSQFMSRVIQTVWTIPIYLAEYIYRALGIKKKVDLITALQRINSMTEVLRFFTMHEYIFHTDNLKSLKKKLSEEDSKLYNLDVHSINWPDLFVDFAKGCKKYILKEDDDNIANAKQNMQRLRLLHYSVIIGFFCVAFYLVLWISSLLM